MPCERCGKGTSELYEFGLGLKCRSCIDELVDLGSDEWDEDWAEEPEEDSNE